MAYMLTDAEAERRTGGLAVVKIGGSFLRHSDSRSCVLGAVRAEAARFQGVLVLPGGGEAADLVRDWQARWGLSDDQAHWLAIAAMDFNAELLARCWFPDAPFLEAPRSDADALRGIALIRPSAWVKAAETGSHEILPRSWEVTSDTLAWFLATWLGANELILLKHLQRAADHLVDPYLGEVCRRHQAPRIRLLDPRTGEAILYDPGSGRPG